MRYDDIISECYVQMYDQWGYNIVDQFAEKDKYQIREDYKCFVPKDGCGAVISFENAHLGIILAGSYITSSNFHKKYTFCLLQATYIEVQNLAYCIYRNSINFIRLVGNRQSDKN